MVGTRSRRRVISAAAASDEPPSSKKSASRPGTSRPRTSTHCSATHVSVSVSPTASTLAGSGHGRAFLSTLPEVRIGSSSMTCRRGTSAAGMVSARRSRICCTSSSVPSLGET